MPHITESLSEFKFLVRIVDEPDYIIGLEMAPARREEFLNQGDWIVLVYAVWSIYDELSIRPAIESVKSRGGKVRLGLRPFDAYAEFAPWCPAIASDAETGFYGRDFGSRAIHDIAKEAPPPPVCLFYRNGKMVHTVYGVMNARRIGDVASEVFADPA